MNESVAKFLTGPTPVETAPRLAAALGLKPDDLRIKRDDLIGLGRTLGPVCASSSSSMDISLSASAATSCSTPCSG